MNHATTVSATVNRGVQAFPRAGLAWGPRMTALRRGRHAMNGDRITPSRYVRPGRRSSGSRDKHNLEVIMANEKGPNVKKKQKCKNCEGKGLLKKGDKVVKCQRCGGTGLR